MSDTRIPKAPVTGLYGALVKRFSTKMLGDVMEPIEVAWNNEPVGRFTITLSRKVQSLHACDERLKAYAHMAVASMVGCGFCLDLGYFLTRTEGLDPDKAREVPRWRESAVFTPLERDVLEYAEAMTATPPTVTDELSDRLLDALGAAALVELGVVISVANLQARTNVAWGVESQGFASSCGLAPLASRPVDAAGRGGARG